MQGLHWSFCSIKHAIPIEHNIRREKPTRSAFKQKNIDKANSCVLFFASVSETAASRMNARKAIKTCVIP